MPGAAECGGWRRLTTSCRSRVSALRVRSATRKGRQSHAWTVRERERVDPEISSFSCLVVDANENKVLHLELIFIFFRLLKALSSSSMLVTTLTDQDSGCRRGPRDRHNPFCSLRATRVESVSRCWRHVVPMFACCVGAVWRGAGRGVAWRHGAEGHPLLCLRPRSRLDNHMEAVGKDLGRRTCGRVEPVGRSLPGVIRITIQ